MSDGTKAHPDIPGERDIRDPGYRRRKRLGKCYEISALYVLENAGASLVHGTVAGKFVPVPIDHAWVVTAGGRIFEPATGHVMSAQEYAEYCDPRVRFTYTREQMCAHMMETGHFGPWEYLTTDQIMAEWRTYDVSEEVS
jgi:hypothetical protein